MAREHCRMCERPCESGRNGLMTLEGVSGVFCLRCGGRVAVLLEDTRAPRTDVISHVSRADVTKTIGEATLTYTTMLHALPASKKTRGDLVAGFNDGMRTMLDQLVAQDVLRVDE